MFSQTKTRFAIGMLILLFTMMVFTGCSFKEVIGSADPMRLNQVNPMNLLNEQTHLLRVDDPLIIVFDSALDHSPENLKHVAIAFDSEGSSAIEISETLVDGGDSKRLVIPPPMGGWYPDTDYYVMIEDTMKYSNGKTLGQKILKTFRVDPKAFHTVTGTLRFPKELVAPDALKFYVSVVNTQDSNILQEQEVKFSKGKPDVSYRITVPESRFGYYLSYELRMNEYTIFDFFEPKGYYAEEGSVLDFAAATEIHMNEDGEKDLTIIEIQEVCDALRGIRKAVFKESMSDYEKIVALHSYVKQNMRYNTEVYNPFRDKVWGEYSGDRMSQVLLDKNAVCVGFAFTMDYLLNLEGIESSLRFGEVVGVYEPLSHIWNVVKLDGKHYNVDFTADIKMSNIDRFNYKLTPNVVFNDDAFGDSMAYKKQEVFECSAVAYDTQFRSYWDRYPEYRGGVTTLQGVIQLPKGEVAPEGGIMLTVLASVGLNKAIPEYDFFYATYVLIPEGLNQGVFTLKTVQAKEGVQLSVESISYGKDKAAARKFFGETLLVKTGTDKNEVLKVPQIQIEEATYISGTLDMPQKEDQTSEDLLIAVIAEAVDGTPTFEADNQNHFEVFMVEKGERSIAFRLPVKKSKAPYIISYEVMNPDGPATDLYEKVAYYNIDQMVKSYDKASKVEALPLMEKCKLKLLKKAE